MTTAAQGLEDPFDEVEQNIDWVERLESVRSRYNREDAVRVAIAYADALRQAILELAEGLSEEELRDLFQSPTVDIVLSIQGKRPDGWTERLKPALQGED